MPKVIDNMGKVLAEFPYDASGEMEAQKMVTGNPNLKLVREDVDTGVPIASAQDRGDVAPAGDFAGVGEGYIPPDKPHPIDPIYGDPTPDVVPGSNAMERSQIMYAGGGTTGYNIRQYKKGGKVK